MNTTPNDPVLTQNNPQFTLEQIAAETQRFMVKVYSYMCLALVITGVVAFYTANSPNIIKLIYGNGTGIWVLIIAQLGVVWYLSARVHKMEARTAMLWYVIYSVLVGLTISFVFIVYTAGSIASTFFVTAGTFGVMSALGYFTKTDLTKMGSLLYMALIGLVIASVVNIFWSNSTLYWITTYAGVLIFVGLTAYDTQKIKNMNIIGNEGTDEDKKEAIIGALSLYLDFINLFLYLLRILGNRR